MKPVYLYLEDGNEFIAESFAYESKEPILSEIVFNTSMQGYQEVITDPSYCDQNIVMTYPLIGNYGINQDDSEAIMPRLKSLIIREYCDHPSNFRSRQGLAQYLTSHKIVGLHRIDTRKLTKLIREKGTMKSIISFEKLTAAQRKALLSKELENDQIQRVSTKTISHFPSNGGKRVVMIDFGYKKKYS